MSKTELKDLKKKYSGKDVSRNICSEVIDFDNIIEEFSRVENQDCPDGLITIKSTVYLVEHFQISIFRTTRKGDRLAQALGTDYTKYFEQHPHETLKAEQLFPDLNNLLKNFSQKLKSHMSRFNVYLDNAKRQCPGKKYKFIFVIEDNSNSIINDEGLSILDLDEFVETILEYPEIDGVLTFYNNTRGKFVVGKDRNQMEFEHATNVLKNLNLCEFMLVLQSIDIEKPSDEMKAAIEKMCHFDAFKKDAISITDDIQVEKQNDKR